MCSIMYHSTCAVSCIRVPVHDHKQYLLRARSISKNTKSNMPTFFQIILNYIILHFNEDISSDFKIKILFFHCLN